VRRSCLNLVGESPATVAVAPEELAATSGGKSF